MTTGEIRDLLTVAVLAVLAIMVVIVMRRTAAAPVVPPTVSPMAAPDGDLRDVKHRLANVEQKMTVLQETDARLRTVERELGEVKGTLNNLVSGQARIERQVDRLIDHHMQEDKA